MMTVNTPHLVVLTELLPFGLMSIHALVTFRSLDNLQHKKIGQE